MIYIGIDISKYKHNCFIAIETNSRQFSFENNLLGFNLLLKEFKPFMREQGYGKTSLYLLRQFQTPKKISKMTDKHYDNIRKLSMGKFSYAKFIELKNLAKNSIGKTSDYHLFQLSNSISYVIKLNKDIKDVESKIIEIMNNYPTYLQSIPGIGIITAAVILAEYGDISLFDNPAQMTSYAGLDSSIKQSGTMEITGKLVKRGSKLLRAALINATLTVMRYTPQFYSYYDKKKQEGKSHRVAQVHLAKKLIRIIFHLEKNKTYFDSKLLK